MSVAIGLIITFLGFLISFLSLGLTTDTNVRLGTVLAGIAVSLVGIMGVLNRHYVKNALWRK